MEPPQEVGWAADWGLALCLWIGWAVVGDWLLLVAGFGFALPQFAVDKARKPIVYFRIYCPTCLMRRTRPTLLLATSAKHHLCFLRLLSGIGSAIIRLVSRKVVLWILWT